MDRRFEGFFYHLECGFASLLGLRGRDRRKIDRGMDRRSNPRVMSRNLIKVIRADGIPRNHIFNLIDLSENGFQFNGLRDMMPGSQIEVVLNIREFNCQIPMDARIVWSQPISMEVIWTREFGRTRMRQAGAKILSIAETDRFVLKDFIDYKLQNLAEQRH